MIGIFISAVVLSTIAYLYREYWFNISDKNNTNFIWNQENQGPRALPAEDDIIPTDPSLNDDVIINIENSSPKGNDPSLTCRLVRSSDIYNSSHLKKRVKLSEHITEELDTKTQGPCRSEECIESEKHIKDIENEYNIEDEYIIL